jgi:hypothetical protein
MRENPGLRINECDIPGLQNYLDFGLCLSFTILKNTKEPNILKLDLFLSPGEVMGDV